MVCCPSAKPTKQQTMSSACMPLAGRGSDLAQGDVLVGLAPGLVMCFCVGRQRDSIFMQPELDTQTGTEFIIKFSFQPQRKGRHPNKSSPHTRKGFESELP